MTDYKLAKQAHRNCMACGNAETNPNALQLDFTTHSDGSVSAQFNVTHRHQGYDGLLHGGMVSTLLDAAMTHCLFSKGVRALTAELLVRFAEPVRVGQNITVTAHFIGQRRGIYQLEAFIHEHKTMCARATSKFIEPKNGITTLD